MRKSVSSSAQPSRSGAHGRGAAERRARMSKHAPDTAACVRAALAPHHMVDHEEGIGEAAIHAAVEGVVRAGRRAHDAFHGMERIIYALQRRRSGQGRAG